jgi:hypothetical protein
MLTYVSFVADGSYHFLGNFRRGQRKLGNFHRLGQNRQKSLFPSVFVSVFIVVEVNTVTAASTSMTGMSSSTASIIASFCHPCLAGACVKMQIARALARAEKGFFVAPLVMVVAAEAIALSLFAHQSCQCSYPSMSSCSFMRGWLVHIRTSCFLPVTFII